MRGSRGIAVLGLLAACGSRTPGHTDVPDPPHRFASRPPLATPGEKMVSDLTMAGIDVATFTIVVGDVVALDGRKAIVVQASVQSSPLVTMIHEVKDSFTSWIDTGTSAPILFRSSELENPKSARIEVTDSEAGTIDAGRYRVRIHTGDDPEVVEHQKVGEYPLYDLNGFLIALRTWDDRPGARATADVIRSRYIWRTEVTMIGSENLVTKLGELPAVRIDGISHRIDRDGNVVPADGERHYSIWISDDADRVPIKLVALTDYGDLQMDISEYTPGAS